MEELEDIIGNSSVKLMMAEDKRRMSEHFNKLAVYGTRSVQIPAVDAGAFYKVKKGVGRCQLLSPDCQRFDESSEDGIL